MWEEITSPPPDIMDILLEDWFGLLAQVTSSCLVFGFPSPDLRVHTSKGERRLLARPPPDIMDILLDDCFGLLAQATSSCRSVLDFPPPPGPKNLGPHLISSCKNDKFMFALHVEINYIKIF